MGGMPRASRWRSLGGAGAAAERGTKSGCRVGMSSSISGGYGVRVCFLVSACAFVSCPFLRAFALLRWRGMCSGSESNVEGRDKTRWSGGDRGWAEGRMFVSFRHCMFSGGRVGESTSIPAKHSIESVVGRSRSQGITCTRLRNKKHAYFRRDPPFKSNRGDIRERV